MAKPRSPGAHLADDCSGRPDQLDSRARLSHVVSRLEKRGFVHREPCAEDRRATNATLTSKGWAKVVATAPGHVATVSQNVIDPLTATDVLDLDRIMGRILGALDPSNDMGLTNPGHGG